MKSYHLRNKKDCVLIYSCQFMFYPCKVRFPSWLLVIAKKKFLSFIYPSYLFARPLWTFSLHVVTYRFKLWLSVRSISHGSLPNLHVVWTRYDNKRIQTKGSLVAGFANPASFASCLIGYPITMMLCFRDSSLFPQRSIEFCLADILKNRNECTVILLWREQNNITLIAFILLYASKNASECCSDGRKWTTLIRP